MTVVRLILVFIVAIVVVAVVVANREPTRLDLVVTRIDVPQYTVVLLAWGFGLFSYAIFALIGEIRLRTRLARSRREIDALTRELTDLRNLPLAGEEEGETGVRHSASPVQSPGAKVPTAAGERS
jgi:uncharacterized integral membrane protein